MAEKNPIEQLRIVAEQLAKVTESMGLEMLPGGFTLQLGPEGMPDIATVAFRIDEDVVGKTDEQRETDRQFKEMMQEEKKSDDEEKFTQTATSAEDLARRLAEGKDILDMGDE